MTMNSSDIPSRSQRNSEKTSFDAPTPKEKEKKKLDLSGKYRVKEGYQVAYGTRLDDNNTVGHHALGRAGEIITLTHDEALSAIKMTTNQRDPVTGRMHGPAIETEEAYNLRLEAEARNAEFLQTLQESLPGNG